MVPGVRGASPVYHVEPSRGLTHVDSPGLHLLSKSIFTEIGLAVVDGQIMFI
jgi:hypothetical protein